MTHKIISKMTYNLSSETLNPTIPDKLGCLQCAGFVETRKFVHMGWIWFSNWSFHLGLSLWSSYSSLSYVFQKIPRLMGWLWSGLRLVGQLGSGVWLSARFQIFSGGVICGGKYLQDSYFMYLLLVAHTHSVISLFGSVFRWDQRLRPNGSTLVWDRCRV